MNMQFDRSKQTLLLEGREYSREDILIMSTELSEDTSSFLKELLLFLADWFDENSFMRVQTSGSTGTPKVLNVRKEQMMQSARLTCEFLSLHAGDTALLCMPLQYIAGKMMVIRALVAGLNLLLRTPSGHPLVDLDRPINFAAMVPLQVFNSLQVPYEKERLSRIAKLIIGGGAIDMALEKEIYSLPGEIYSTYGMTETLSHIALRRLNGPLASSSYVPFSSVRLSLSTEDTLVIHAPLVCDEVLITNDIIKFNTDGSFVVLGRKDNIINSGGIKIQIEEVEELIKPSFPFPFAITYVADSKLGQTVVLLIESEIDKDWINNEIALRLDKYQRPHYIFSVTHIPMTGSGKVDRANCHLLAEKLLR